MVEKFRREGRDWIAEKEDISPKKQRRRRRTRYSFLNRFGRKKKNRKRIGDPGSKADLDDDDPEEKEEDQKKPNIDLADIKTFKKKKTKKKKKKKKGKKNSIEALLSQQKNEKEVQPTTLDEDFYRANNPDVNKAIKKGDFKSGQHHFKTFGNKEARSASFTGSGDEFNEKNYLAFFGNQKIADF